jgi:hypothetical protein
VSFAHAIQFQPHTSWDLVAAVGRARGSDILIRLHRGNGIMAVLRKLTTGDMNEESIFATIIGDVGSLHMELSPPSGDDLAVDHSTNEMLMKWSLAGISEPLAKLKFAYGGQFSDRDPTMSDANVFSTASAVPTILCWIGLWHATWMRWAS